MIRQNYLEGVTNEDLIKVNFESLIESLNLRLGLISEQHSPNGQLNEGFINQLKIIKSLANRIYSNGNGPLLLGLEYLNLKNSPLYKLLYREENIKPISIISIKELGLKRDENIVNMINNHLKQGLGIVGGNHLNKEVIQNLQKEPILVYPWDKFKLEDGIYKLNSKQDTYLTTGLI